ncbi:hypothetical protein CHS0354_002636 [Potamilus streckersoni]|uniref:C1q domain-containing protein n=1 Tax=Potamilus streckersoni TaxID=2493646 RepID=A0AAE0VHA6_9BIVA|nr:hypothetical protein CHS0354_002636 [Potamilus streckersoni]
MNWFLCLWINACILSYANALFNTSESEEHESVLALLKNLDQPEIIASSNKENDRLYVLDRELQKVKEENRIFRSHLSNLEELIKQFQNDNLDTPAIPIKRVNGTMKRVTQERDDRKTKIGVYGILSKSLGSPVNVLGQYMKRQDDRVLVAFFAQLSVSLTDLGMNQIIQFNNVVTNIGEGYYPNLGIFIAPVKGLYVFHVRVMVASGMRQYLAIVKDGVWTQPLYPTALGDQHPNIDSVTIVLQVNKDSAVWVRAESGSGYLHGNKFSIFSGWLLSPL